MNKTAITVLLLLSAAFANAEWEADPANKKQVASADAIAQIKERIPRSQPFFEDAYGMAVYPSVTRLGFGFGGAGGKGFVMEGATIIGGEMALSGEADAYGHRKLGGIGQTTGELLKQKTGEGIIATPTIDSRGVIYIGSKD